MERRGHLTVGWCVHHILRQRSCLIGLLPIADKVVAVGLYQRCLLKDGIIGFLYHRVHIEDIQVVGIAGKTPQPLLLLERVVVVLTICLSTTTVSPTLVVFILVLVDLEVVVQPRDASVILTTQEVLTIVVGEGVIGLHDQEVEIVVTITLQTETGQ